MSLTLNKTRFSPAQARVVPFVIFIAFIALESLLQSTVAAASLHNFDLRWLYAVRIMFTAAALAYFWRYYVELKSAIDIPISQWLTAIAVGIGVFILWINLDHPWLRTSVGKGFIPLESDGTLNIWLTIIRLTGAALIVPIIEELFWRSFILRWLDNQNFCKLTRPASARKHSGFLRHCSRRNIICYLPVC